MRQRYNALVQDAVDDLLSLIGADDLAAIEAALERLSGFPDEVLVHWDTLRQHRDDLVRTARMKLREAAASQDPAAIAAALDRHREFGEAARDEAAAAAAQLQRLVDAARAEILAATNAMGG
jgi:hypothetical protein